MKWRTRNLLLLAAIAPGVGVAMALLSSLIDWFSTGISKGEWLQLAATILISGIAYISAWRYLRRERYPFKVRFSDLKYRELGNKNLRRCLHLKPGKDQTFTMRFQLKMERKMHKLDLRFVNWKICGRYDGEFKWFDYFDAPTGKVNVSHVEGQETQFETCKTDRKGGQEFMYRVPQAFSEGHSLWLTVTVNANATWRGKLSLQLISGDNRRAFGRATVIVGDTLWSQFREAMREYKQLV